jgi:hypothetical protein
MAGEPDEKSSVFACESFSEVEQKAREVLRERGLSDTQIDAQLSATKRAYADWPPSDGQDSADKASHGQ